MPIRGGCCMMGRKTDFFLEAVMKPSYRLTTLCCIVGTFVQAIIANLTAILFVPMMGLYGFNFIHLGILVGVNFGAQVTADILLSGTIDKKGFRFFVLPACLLAFFGLVFFAAAPLLFPGHIFVGLLLATVVFAFSSGMLEVLLSPIIDAIPGGDKGPAMSLMHSFYAWGQVITIILTTLFVYAAGRENWQIITLLWAAVPLTCFFMFLRAPFPQGTPPEERQGMRQLLFHPFYLLALGAIFCGAGTEIVLNQWFIHLHGKGAGAAEGGGGCAGHVRIRGDAGAGAAALRAVRVKNRHQPGADTGGGGIGCLLSDGGPFPLRRAERGGLRGMRLRGGAALAGDAGAGVGAVPPGGGVAVRGAGGGGRHRGLPFPPG